jgi:hypothetical protein
VYGTGGASATFSEGMRTELDRRHAALLKCAERPYTIHRNSIEVTTFQILYKTIAFVDAARIKRELTCVMFTYAAGGSCLEFGTICIFD